MRCAKPSNNELVVNVTSTPVRYAPLATGFASRTLLDFIEQHAEDFQRINGAAGVMKVLGV